MGRNSKISSANRSAGISSRFRGDSGRKQEATPSISTPCARLSAPSPSTTCLEGGDLLRLSSGNQRRQTLYEILKSIGSHPSDSGSVGRFVTGRHVAEGHPDR